ncbi:hypothetical protein, partial [Streptomyces sp. NPDC058620]|uniref:hypothetical protein n=1 Tax=Streptomyces sp. NPDC058620 TaxID=3346560 RepID=UPI003653A23A
SYSARQTTQGFNGQERRGTVPGGLLNAAPRASHRARRPPADAAPNGQRSAPAGSDDRHRPPPVHSPTRAKGSRRGSPTTHHTETRA